jgi:hypothetical protein
VGEVFTPKPLMVLVTTRSDWAGRVSPAFDIKRIAANKATTIIMGRNIPFMNQFSFGYLCKPAARVSHFSF